jgi:YggT family protein
MYPIVMLISSLVSLLNIGLFAYVITGMLISFNIVNPYQPVVQRVMYALKRIYEPMLKPIRKYLPDLGGLDVSPIILFLLFNFVDNALRYYLLPIG